MSGPAKTGLDDYLVSHGPEELKSLTHIPLKHRAFAKQHEWWKGWKRKKRSVRGNEASSPSDQRTGKEIPYSRTNKGLFWSKETPNGPIDVQLTNYVARIISDIAQDDGVEVRRLFEIEGSLDGRTLRFTIPAAQFASMHWGVEQLGARATIYPGMGARDHARVAIQLLSERVTERRIFTHIGWRELDGQWVYLSGSGGIWRDGLRTDLQVELPDSLAGYALPAPPSRDAAEKAVRSALGFVDLAPDFITIPLLAATFRAALGGIDFSVHVVGPTGVFKSEIAALVQQHFGPRMDSRHLPGSWASTANALEGLAFAAKDAVLTVDDFAPRGNTQDIFRFHSDADRILRAQGNRAGRQRMRADGTLRAAKPPRGLILSTGEDVPLGQSLRSRMLIIRLSSGDVDRLRLSEAQTLAAEGQFALAMSAFLHRAAPDYGHIATRLPLQIAELRQRALRSAAHRRTPDIIANLILGWSHLLDFASEVGAISQPEAHDLRQRGYTAFERVAMAQTAYQEASEPARRFIELLGAALVSGHAHVATPGGGAPEQAEAWGWRRVRVGNGENPQTEWRPSGERVGWIDDSGLFLEPDASFVAVQGFARRAEDSLGISIGTLKRRLKERGVLARVDDARETITVRRKLEGMQRNVLHLHHDALNVVAPEERVIPDDGPDDRIPGRSPEHPDQHRSHFELRELKDRPSGDEGQLSTSDLAPATSPDGNGQSGGNGSTVSTETAEVPPSEACRICGALAWWTAKTGKRVCGVCHPDPAAKDPQPGAVKGELAKV